jgi:hypothetical protein
MHSSVVIALIVLACVFGGALLGMWLGARLPAHHVDKQTQNLVKLGMGTIATLMALVLGLLVGTAKASFDTTATHTNEFAAKVVQLDHILGAYGPETAPIRRRLRTFMTLKIDELWGAERPHGLSSENGVILESALSRVVSLAPRDERQKALQARALQLTGDIGQTRWLLIEHTAGASIPGPFLGILVFWAGILFVSFGLFAPRHATAVAVLLVCALSIAAAIFVILEMDHPFSGVIRIPSGAARSALAHMGQP